MLFVFLLPLMLVNKDYQNDLTTTYTCTIEMTVTIEDGVYSLVIEVKIESVFDNGNGRMIRTTDI